MNKVSKIFILILLAICGTSSLFLTMGQKAPLRKKVHSFSFAYGYKTDTKWWREMFDEIQADHPKTTNDGYVKYEFGLNKRMGIGFEMVFIENIDRYKYPTSSERYTYSINARRLKPFLNYNFFTSSKFVAYANLAAGIYITRVKIVHTYPDPNPLNSLGFPPGYSVSELVSDRKKTGFDFAAGLGIKYFFHPNFGIGIESGINKSVFQAAIIIKTTK